MYMYLVRRSRKSLRTFFSCVSTSVLSPDRPASFNISLTASSPLSWRRRQVHRLSLIVMCKFLLLRTLIIIYSCCCRSSYAIDHTPTHAGRACKISSQRTRARATRGCTIIREWENCNTFLQVKNMCSCSPWEKLWLLSAYVSNMPCFYLSILTATILPDKLSH